MEPRDASRSNPAHGVLIDPRFPTIVFVTVCTRDRLPWLATEANHSLLRQIWDEATAWVVGHYVLMPDHLQLFAAPGNPESPLDNWIRFWKSRFTKRQASGLHPWQAHHWDTRLRSGESYEEKWRYVRDNPVRAQLVMDHANWPFQGQLHELRWE